MASFSSLPCMKDLADLLPRLSCLSDSGTVLMRGFATARASLFLQHDGSSDEESSHALSIIQNALPPAQAVRPQLWSLLHVFLPANASGKQISCRQDP